MDEKETPPNRFESEMTRMMKLVILKLGGLETRFDGLETNVFQIKSDVQVIKGKFSDVAVMAIEDNKRITKLEGEIAELQSDIH